MADWIEYKKRKPKKNGFYFTKTFITKKKIKGQYLYWLNGYWYTMKEKDATKLPPIAVDYWLDEDVQDYHITLFGFFLRKLQKQGLITEGQLGQILHFPDLAKKLTE